jgi:hypothetical protein
MGPVVLLYGGRNRAADFFFEKEWEELSRILDLTVLTAFSRDQKNKIYVQDVLSRNSGLFLRMLHEMKGMVFICGSSGRMPRAVREALIETFQGAGTRRRADRRRRSICWRWSASDDTGRRPGDDMLPMYFEIMKSFKVIDTGIYVRINSQTSVLRPLDLGRSVKAPSLALFFNRRRDAVPLEE